MYICTPYMGQFWGMQIMNLPKHRSTFPVAASGGFRAIDLISTGLSLEQCQIQATRGQGQPSDFLGKNHDLTKTTIRESACGVQ